MACARGSEWRKWDLHVHTPYSILNNNYGFNPYEEFTDKDPFDTFVINLFTKAIEKNIAAIGITDYFSIDGYKRIKREYLENEEKLMQLFPDDECRSRVKSILILPNIELRLNTFVGEHSVNYHVVFSDKVPIDDIEQNFLNRLQTMHQAGSQLSITHQNIARIGKEYKECNTCSGDDYFVGLQRVTVNYEIILEVLKSSIFQDKYFITIPVDEDLSCIDWKGRDYSTRKVLYQQCDCLLTSNERTRKWALAKGHEEEQKREFRTIKPCIWGSDAHEYERMFSPAENRYCWIKAEPTFEGFQQILYEPEERVKIQENCPEEKDPHQVIDSICFKDDRFQEEPIYFSEGLTCIIGGKSTGKSILLRHIGAAVAKEHVAERERLVNSSRDVLSVSVDVRWKDGASGERKIVYIPQSWLNRIVDEKGDDSALNTLIRDILLQQDDISNADQLLKRRIAEICEEIKHRIVDYVSVTEKAVKCEELLQEEGRSEAFESSILKLSDQRKEMSAAAGITDEVLQQYADLEKRIGEEESVIKKLQAEEALMDFHNTPFVYIPEFTTIDRDVHQTYCFSGVSTVQQLLSETVEQINKMIADIWEPAKTRAQATIVQNKGNASGRLQALNEEFMPLKQRVAMNEQLKKIDVQLSEEKKRLERAKELEQEKEACIAKGKELQRQIIESRRLLYEAYSDFCLKINNATRQDTMLEFSAEIEVKKQGLYETIISLFDNRGFRAYKDKYGYNLSEKDELGIDDKLFLCIWEAMINRQGLGGLSLKGGNTIQTALERLFADWFHVHFTVKSGGDTINNMSPGKKALVLLELIINIERGNCPILIDQPEDDLDNRSIYTDLVQYIKSKKHERQIIVVTHNANVVVGADAEEVIIANQAGREAINNSRRFEYRCGAIENTSPVFDSEGNIINGILNQKGIQEQICDILEGGKKAFELRKNKYFSI